MATRPDETGRVALECDEFRFITLYSLFGEQFHGFAGSLRDSIKSHIALTRLGNANGQTIRSNFHRLRLAIGERIAVRQPGITDELRAYPRHIARPRINQKLVRFRAAEYGRI